MRGKPKPSRIVITCMSLSGAAISGDGCADRQAHYREGRKHYCNVSCPHYLDFSQEPASNPVPSQDEADEEAGETLPPRLPLPPGATRSRRGKVWQRRQEIIPCHVCLRRWAPKRRAVCYSCKPAHYGAGTKGHATRWKKRERALRGVGSAFRQWVKDLVQEEVARCLRGEMDAGAQG